ncbi:MAG: VWA domain-containing protein [Cyanobacteria bacterium]|nr:VWA domain-containing protein [Cyanobacteriota bacterium]
MMFLGLVVGLGLSAQSFDSLALAQDKQEQPLPRFRAGANLVRVDTYVSKEDVAVLDLKAEDFTVFEDDKPQTIAGFELLQARQPVTESQRRDPTNTREMRQQAEDAVRLFTLFFDPLTTSMAGGYRLRKPLLDTLEKVIGDDDAVGVMTPEMSPSSITYGRRLDTIESMVSKWWETGRRDQRSNATPQESAIAACYPPPDNENRGIAAAMIGRLREQKTLDALSNLITHLEGLREDRKFVMIFTEGWMLYRPDAGLSRGLKGTDGPLPDPIRVDPRTGGLRPQNAPDPDRGRPMSLNQCEQLRIKLSQVDHERDFLTMLQRANRANVSFYPVDARGLVVFDQPTNFDLLPTQDQAILRHRWDFLRDMAGQTDGQAVLDQGDLTRALQKVFRDLGSYYLLSYYSTNSRLDGRFRRIRVEVNRPGVDVRARPGYLAPTEAEARGAGAFTSASRKPAPPPTVTRALDSLAPARGNLPVRVQAVGGRSSIRTIVELDAVTAKQPEWLSGGTLRLTFEPDRATSTSSAAPPQTMTVAIEPGQRSIVVNSGQPPLAAGRYAVRAELTARNSRLPLQVTTFATVPADAAEIGTGGLASRRGPSTGLAYIATADPRFRRTERLRLEVPLAGDGFTGSGRLLTREGQATPLIVSYSSRSDEATKQPFGVADVTLAPLAEGEYVLELSLTKDGKTETVTYGFRMIP